MKKQLLMLVALVAMVPAAHASLNVDFDALKNRVEQVKQVLPDLKDKVQHAISLIKAGNFDELQQHVANNSSEIADVLQQAANAIQSSLPQIKSSLQNALSTIKGFVPADKQSAFGDIKNALKQLDTNNGANAITQLKQYITSENIKAGAARLAAALKEAVESNTYKTTFKPQLEKIGAAFNQTVSKIQSADWSAIDKTAKLANQAIKGQIQPFAVLAQGSKGIGAIRKDIIPALFAHLPGEVAALFLLLVNQVDRSGFLNQAPQATQQRLAQVQQYLASLASTASSVDEQISSTNNDITSAIGSTSEISQPIVPLLVSVD